MSVKYEDYYKVLGVSKSASQQEIQKAFKKMAKKYHPDVSKEPNAEAQFKRANEAYEVLKNPETRSQYDAFGGNYKAGQNVRPPPGWGGGGGAGQNVRFEDLFGGQPGGGQSGGFSDFFNMFMGGAGPQASGGSPFGGQGSPFGGGANPYADFGSAPNAGRSPRGTAQKKKGRTRELDFEVPLEVLYRNGKHGFIVRRAGGEEKSYTIKVPAGSTEGSQIRLGKQGDAGTGGGVNGDLVLTIRVVDRAEFEVHGFDLRRPVDVSPWEAISGAKVSVETFEGSVNLTIPPNLKPGAKLRLKGRGLAREDGTRGALYVVPRVVISADLSERERALYAELEELSDFDPRP